MPNLFHQNYQNKIFPQKKLKEIKLEDNGSFQYFLCIWIELRYQFCLIRPHNQIAGLSIFTKKPKILFL